MRSKLLGFVAALALTASPITASASRMLVIRSTVLIYGPILPSDIRAFTALAGSPAIDTVMLNSPGGLIGIAEELADIIKVRRFSVVVPSKGECYSACFIMLAAGAHKVVGIGAKIGVHNATRAPGSGVDYTQGTISMAQYSADFGVPDSILKHMMRTSSASMYQLTPGDLHNMDVEPADIVMPSPLPAPSTSVERSKHFDPSETTRIFAKGAARGPAPP